MGIPRTGDYARWTAADAAILLQQTQDDPEVLAEFRRAYHRADGDGDAVDMLMWFVDLEATGSSGVHNPALRIPELQRQVYGRATSDQRDNTDRVRAAVELDELLQVQSRSLRALDSAITAVRECVVEEQPPALPPLEAVAEREGAMRRWPGALVAVAVVVAVGVVIQALLPQPVSLEVFDRVQTPEEGSLEGLLSIEFAASDGTVRVLAVEEGVTLLAYLSAQAILPAIAGLNSVCVVAEYAGNVAVAGCSSVVSFGTTGMHGALESGGVPYEFHWGPRGEASFAATKLG